MGWPVVQITSEKAPSATTPTMHQHRCITATDTTTNNAHSGNWTSATKPRVTSTSRSFTALARVTAESVLPVNVTVHLSAVGVS
eukprot:CAMPEP_0171712214 /NCGR_PEP_ID=MMETSP0991-20121206/17050_1 /TAXON_ID=483369 /ORGANISM="non described non described, Strain CCMP2098" /LENGTH=83 /DNA_ID=CAMNT_0012302689 /DNA_START=716 /DNA_END=967 /DNA_ORIENTATION=-